MSEPTPKFEASPIQVELEAGKTYFWCKCGRTKTRPFCDGSHEGTGCDPVEFVARADGMELLCGCHESDDAPYCDGTHNVL